MLYPRVGKGSRIGNRRQRRLVVVRGNTRVVSTTTPKRFPGAVRRRDGRSLRDTRVSCSSLLLYYIIIIIMRRVPLNRHRSGESPAPVAGAHGHGFALYNNIRYNYY